LQGKIIMVTKAKAGASVPAHKGKHSKNLKLYGGGMVGAGMKGMATAMGKVPEKAAKGMEKAKEMTSKAKGRKA
jgi:hypothetical protein